MEPLVTRLTPPRQSVQSLILYYAWFVFCPIPLHAMNVSIDILTLTSRCCIRLPQYLSRGAKCSVVAVALCTHINLLASMGLAVAVVLTGDVSCHFLPLTLPQEKTEADNALIYWIRFNILVLMSRAASRGAFHWDMQRRGGVVSTSNTEHQFDLSVWSGLMILSSWRLYHALQEGGVQVLMQRRGLSADQGHLLSGLAWCFAECFFVDIVLRFLWLFIAPRLAQDFKVSDAHRIVESLPQGDSSQQCPICLVGDDSRDYVQLPCSHSFHRVCLLSWARCNDHRDANFSCPMCRLNLGRTTDGYDNA